MDLGPLAALAALVTAVAAFAFRSSVHVVRANERMVVFRAGRADPSLVRGPGRALLIPVIDRGVVVGTDEHSVAVSAVTGKTADERTVAADLSISVRVTDPFLAAINTVSFDRAVTRLLAREFATAVGGLSLEQADSRRLIESRMLGAVQNTLARWGAAGDILEVRNLGSPTGEASGFEDVGVDLPGIGALSRDSPLLPWIGGQLRSMAIATLLVLACGYVFVLLVNLVALDDAPISLWGWFTLAFLGTLIPPVAVMPGGRTGFLRQMGWRTPLWVVLALLWIVATDAAIVAMFAALGLDVFS